MSHNEAVPFLSGNVNTSSLYIHLEGLSIAFSNFRISQVEDIYVCWLNSDCDHFWIIVSLQVTIKLRILLLTRIFSFLLPLHSAWTLSSRRRMHVGTRQRRRTGTWRGRRSQIPHPGSIVFGAAALRYIIGAPSWKKCPRLPEKAQNSSIPWSNKRGFAAAGTWGNPSQLFALARPTSSSESRRWRKNKRSQFASYQPWSQLSLHRQQFLHCSHFSQ